MSVISPDEREGFIEPYGVGPVAQCYTTQPAPAAPVAASASWQSMVYTSNGYRTLSVAVNSSQNATISVQRFVDEYGVIPQGAPITASVTAGSYGVVNIMDDIPFGSFQVTITNNGASAATLTGFTVYQEAR